MNAACAVDPAVIVMAATEQDVSAGELLCLVHIAQLVPLYWCLVEYPCKCLYCDPNGSACSDPGGQGRELAPERPRGRPQLHLQQRQDWLGPGEL